MGGCCTPARAVAYRRAPHVEAVDVIDLAESRVVRHLELPGPVLDISPDGRRLAVADARRGDGSGGGAGVRLGDVVLVDATNGAERSRLPGDDVGPVTRIRFGVDGRSLSVVTASNSVVVWSGDTGRRLEELRGHAGAVLDAASYLAVTKIYTSGEEGTILVWDTRGDRSFARNPVTTAATGSDWVPDRDLARRTLGRPQPRRDGRGRAATHPAERRRSGHGPGRAVGRHRRRTDQRARLAAGRAPAGDHRLGRARPDLGT